MVAVNDKPQLLIVTVPEWESWLDANPDHDGIRLQLRKKASAAPGMLYDEALESALCYGWIDGQTQSLDRDCYLQVFTPRRPRSVWSQRNVEIVARLMAAGRMRPAGLIQVERAQADGRWDAAYRQRGTEVPDDLAAALAASPAASERFAALSAQERFGVVFRLQTLKRAETRARRIASYVGMLEQGRSPLEPRGSTGTMGT